MNDWEWDGVLVALDFTPQLICDICEIHHPANWHCRMSCGCSVFVCDSWVIDFACIFLDRDVVCCPFCSTSDVYVKRGRVI